MTSPSTVRGLWLAGVSLLSLAASTQGIAKDVKDAKDDWDVNAPPLSVEGKQVNVNVTSGTWMSLDVSPDGKWIAFDLLGDIYKIPMEGGKAQNIAAGVAWEIQPRFSPDGSKIAFTSDRSGGDNIWVMDADGGNAHAVTSEPFRLLNNPTWSKDGTTIAARKHYTTTRSLGTGEIWLYHVSGKGSGLQVVKRPNPQYQKELGEPMFTADGTGIYYTQNVTSGNIFEYAQNSGQNVFNIKRVDLADGDTTTVAGGPGGAVRPTPSPDGKYLAFVRRVRAESRLFLRDLATGDEFMVYDQLDRDMQEGWAVHGLYPNMDWTPDSKQLVFWAGGKIKKLTIADRTVETIPFEVKDERTVYAPPRLKVKVGADNFDTKMVRFATPSPDGKSIVFESLGSLWVKRGDKAPEKLVKNTLDGFQLSPVWSKDSKTVYFLSWHDEKLGQIYRVRAGGGKAKAVSDRAGHFADLSLSNDGKSLFVRKRSGGRLLTPKGGVDSGIYKVTLKNGDFTEIADSGARPHQAADGRIYFNKYVKGKMSLVSVNEQGFDEQVRATTDWATGIALSPDGKSVAWRENYHIYSMPLPASGKTVKLSPRGSGMPVTRLTRDGGLYFGWTDNSEAVYWSLGPTLKQAAIADTLSAEFKAPETGINLSMTVASDQPSGVVALTGARIITMNADLEVLENGTILIEDNKITKVGSTVAIPDGAKTVDMQGKTILPGLIDVHAHGAYGSGNIIPQQNYNQQAHLALGVTTTHNPSSSARSVFAAAEYQQAGKIISPRTYSTAEIVYGAKASYWAPVDAVEDAIAHIRRLKAQGAISVKNYNQPRRNQRQQVVEAARREGLMVVAEGGSLYHQDMNLIVDGNTGVEHSLPNLAIYEDVLEFWPQTKVGYTPTLMVGFGGIEGEKYFYQKYDVWKHPILSKFVPPRDLQARSVRRMKAPDADHVVALNAKIGKQLLDRGVSVHIGAHGQREGLASHWEMWGFVLGGMTPMEALQAATVLPAQYLGFDDDIGTIESGKLADLLILDANPLEDIHNSDNIHRIMLNGRLYTTNLDEVVTGDRKRAAYHWEGKPESDIR